MVSDVWSVVLAVVLVCAIGVLLLWIGRKAGRTEDKVAQLTQELTRVDNVFKQVEDLAALYYLISPRLPFPETRGWAASPDFLRVIVDRILQHRPKTVLELGSGVSTLVTGYALERLGAGHLYSLDHDKEFLGRTEHNVRSHGLGEYVTLVHAPLVPGQGGQNAWYDVNKLPSGKIDMVIIDGPPAATGPMARFPALPLLFDRLSCNVVIILDDAARPDEQACVQRWQDADDSLTVEQIECEKGCAVLTRHVVRPT